MNYIEVSKKRSPTIDVEIYDSELSYFEKAGKLSIKSLYRDSFIEDGIKFYCQYVDEDKEFSFETKDIVYTQLQILKGDLSKYQQINEPYIYKRAEASAKDLSDCANLELLLIKKSEITIDFRLAYKDEQNKEHEVVIEIKPEDFEKLLK